jgi:hypothetical protein
MTFKREDKSISKADNNKNEQKVAVNDKKVKKASRRGHPIGKKFREQIDKIKE